MSAFSGARSGLRRLGRAAGRVQGAVLFTAVYFLVIGPISLALRLAGRRLLGSSRPATTFVPARAIEDPETFGRRQF